MLAWDNCGRGSLRALLPFLFMRLVAAFYTFFWLSSAAWAAAPVGALQSASTSHGSAVHQEVKSRLQRAQSYISEDQAPEAESLLQKILKSNPRSPEANDLLGSLQLQHRQFAEAEEHFESALTVNRHDETARRGERDAAVGLALQLRKAGDASAALLSLEHAKTFLPDDPILLTDLGIEADSLHDYDRAAEALDAVLKERPGDPTALYASARTELDRDNPKKAETLFHAYLAQRPDDASAHYGLGRLFQRQQRTDEASAEFHRALEIQPVQTESYYQLGQMALDAHRDPEARAMFEKTLSRLPTHGGARTGIGILDYRAKDYKLARGSLEQAIANSPDYETAHYYLGLTLARLGDKEASARELQVAAQLAAKQQGKGTPIGVVSPDVQR